VGKKERKRRKNKISEIYGRGRGKPIGKGQ
jgi:hypothetical protein